MRNGRVDVAFLLGKPPKQSTIFPEVFARLETRGLHVRTHLPHEADGTLPNRGLPDWAQGAAVVVNRGLKRRVLVELGAHERRGVRFCNPVAASLLLGDRPGLLRALEAAGVPVPRTEQVETWAEVVAASEARKVVVKAADGGPGRGVGVVVVPDEPLPTLPPFGGPYLVQGYVAGDGWDRKLYVAGARTFGLLKRPLPAGGLAAAAEAFTPSQALSALAARVGDALNLDLYGVDVLEGQDGPVVIDVNGFPGYRGVAGAAEAVAAHIGALAGRG